MIVALLTYQSARSPITTIISERTNNCLTRPTTILHCYVLPYISINYYPSIKYIFDIDRAHAYIGSATFIFWIYLGLRY
jgi:hypothetical protein